MDLYKAIRELVEEKKRIDKLIAGLEAAQEKERLPVQNARVRPASSGRRGRKGMSAEERREVSERMARYWAARRQERTGQPETGPSERSIAKSEASTA